MCFKIKELILTMDFEHPKHKHINYEDYCTDVIVIAEEEANGNKNLVKYVASFFSYLHIRTLSQLHETTGDFKQGQYFYSKNMLLINTCEPANIYKVIQHLIEEGNFLEVFNKITKPNLKE